MLQFQVANWSSALARFALFYSAGKYGLADSGGCVFPWAGVPAFGFMIRNGEVDPRPMI